MGKRKIYVVGNWKMHKTSRDAVDYIEKLLPHVKETENLICLAVPFTSIALASEKAEGTRIAIGAQNMHDATEGAFTGEIAGPMLKEAGASFVLLGHSERRHIFQETNEWIHRKVHRALQEGILPVLCIGETLEERLEGQTEEVLKKQLVTALEGVSESQAEHLIVAYEPVWAIGTGKAATPLIAEEVHLFCRSVLSELFGKKIGGGVSILYGGSVSPQNVAGFIKEKNIDGVLVGGASLNLATFVQLIELCKK
jgi:triosephosphate isomerase